MREAVREGAWGEAAERWWEQALQLQACVLAQLRDLSLFLSELLRLPCSLACSPCSVSGPGSWIWTDVQSLSLLYELV